MQTRRIGPMVWVVLVFAWGLLLGGCANVAFDHGGSPPDDKALIFGRIILDRDGEKAVVSPFSTPVVIRDVTSGEEPRQVLQGFDADGSFVWALPPGHYQVSLVLHGYTGGVVSYAFRLGKPGHAYYFGDLTLHGRKRFDTIGGANIRNIRPELQDRFADAKTELMRRNAKIETAAVQRLTLNDMSDAAQRASFYEEVMADRPSCCSSKAQMPFKQMGVGQRMVETISPDSPVYDFLEGRSHFIAWELPRDSASLMLDLRSQSTPSTMPGANLLYVFSPAVMLLDEQFNVIADQQHGLFAPVSASIMPVRTASLQARISLSGQMDKARYLILYTSRSIIEGSWRTTRPGVVPIAGGVLPIGTPVGVSLEPSIYGVIEAEIRAQ